MDTYASRVNKFLQHATNKTQASSGVAQFEAAKGAVKRRRRDASEASTTQTAPSVASYGDALIARVTADVTATVTTSIGGIIKETVEAAVRQAMEGQSGATSGDGVDGLL